MAPKTNEQLRDEFQAFIPYIQSLQTLGDTGWETPVAEGKWSLKEILCHLLCWDKYFYEEAFAKIKAGQPLTARHQNFNEFNASAAGYAQTLTWQETVAEFILYRSLMIEEMTGISDEEFSRGYPDGDGKTFSYKGHLRGFLPHDKHHKKQMDKFVQTYTASIEA